MPYITDDRRREIDPLLGQLIARLGDLSDRPGEANYVVTRILAETICAEPRYTKINTAVGVLNCVEAEFYRRLAAPYEDQAIAKNGDIGCYAAMKRSDQY